MMLGRELTHTPIKINLTIDLGSCEYRHLIGYEVELRKKQLRYRVTFEKENIG